MSLRLCLGGLLRLRVEFLLLVLDSLVKRLHDFAFKLMYFSTMLRIEEYEKESIRFSELFRTIPQVSEKVLASTLDYLLQEGLVTRERFEEVPPRVEYSLTPIAKDFLREISYVIEWGQLHFEQIVKGRK